jgi:hypothetical protein
MKLVNSGDLKPLKLLFLLRHVSAETPEIRRVRVFQHNRPFTELGSRCIRGWEIASQAEGRICLFCCPISRPSQGKGKSIKGRNNRPKIQAAKTWSEDSRSDVVAYFVLKGFIMPLSILQSGSEIAARGTL